MGNLKGIIAALLGFFLLRERSFSYEQIVRFVGIVQWSTRGVLDLVGPVWDSLINASVMMYLCILFSLLYCNLSLFLITYIGHRLILDEITWVTFGPSCGNTIALLNHNNNLL